MSPDFPKHQPPELYVPYLAKDGQVVQELLTNITTVGDPVELTDDLIVSSLSKITKIAFLEDEEEILVILGAMRAPRVIMSTSSAIYKRADKL